MTGFVERERVVQVAPLGVRFWDVGAGVPARAALRATARELLPGGRVGRPIAAVVTGLGVYAFPVVGPAAPADEPGPGSVPAGRCRIDVDDPDGRFLPTRLETPLRGWQLSTVDCLIGSPPAPAGLAPDRCVPLFSAPARPVPAGLAAVRGDLELADGTPARWALVVVRPEGGPPAYGVAGADGRVVVLLPWPEPPATAVDSPVGLPAAIPRQGWQLDVEVRTDPAVATRREPAELCALLEQPAATVPAAPELHHGRDTALRSPGRSTFVVVPTP